MTPESEEQYIGSEIDRVPKVEPGAECNGKKVEKTESSERLFAGYCSLRAGWGVVEGGEDGRRCKLHGGVPSGGAPKANQNAAKHALNSDPHHYFESLPPEQREFIDGIAVTIQDRVREMNEEVDQMDVVLSRRVSIKLHIVSKASAYVANESGLIQEIVTGQTSYEKAAPLLTEIRRYDDSIFENLETLGVLDDPESLKTGSVQAWHQFVRD